MTEPARWASHRDLLWYDSRAGLAVGMGGLLLSGWLSELYRIPTPLLVAMALVNLAYGACSGLLARLAVRPSALILLLVIANAAWAVVCVALAVRLAPTASTLGLAVLIFEAAFVGGLALLEWRARHRLRHAPA